MTVGLAPAAFWDLSLQEWRWLVEPSPANVPLTHAGLAALLHQFPDHKNDLID